MPSSVDVSLPPKVPRRLYSERLLLRPFRVADTRSLHAAAGEDIEELGRRFTNLVPDLATPEGTRRYIARCRTQWRSGQYLEYGVFARSGGALLGAIALGPDWGTMEFDLTFWLRLSARGSGYAAESATAITAYAMESLGARALEMAIDPDNLGTRRVAERLGYVLSGTMEDPGFSPGTREGARLIFRLTAEMWAARGDSAG